MNTFNFLDYLLIVLSIAVSLRVYAAGHAPPGGASQHNVPSLPAIAGGVTPAPALAQDRVLTFIVEACGYDGIDTFLDGARQAYEIVVGAFSSGTLASCAGLLSPTLHEAFTEILAGRAARGDTVETMFIGFRNVTIEDAGSDRDYAWIDVRFMAELVTVTKDRNGAVISGSADQVAVTSEVWTFERDLSSRMPVWTLTATDDDA